MALEGPGRVMRTEKTRTMVYITQRVAGDSAFPFRPGDELWVRIDREGGRVVLERARKGGGPVHR